MCVVIFAFTRAGASLILVDSSHEGFWGWSSQGVMRPESCKLSVEPTCLVCTSFGSFGTCSMRSQAELLPLASRCILVKSQETGH